jgi:signal transduction histidine kinase
VRGFAELPALISRNILTRYSTALGLALVAVVLQWTLQPVLGNAASDLALFPAIALSAWLCGLGPSLLTVVLGLCIPAYLFAPLQRSSALPPSSLLEAVAFMLAAGAIIAVAEWSRRRDETLRESQDDLEQRVRQRTIELDAANQNLRELTARLLKSQDEERRRIARELHDSVGQTVAALAMNLSTVGADIERLLKTARTVADSAALVNDMSTDIRTISYLLHPPLLDEAGLSSALRWYTEGFSERSGIHVDLDFPDNFARLPRDMETAIFRVVQECLTNIHRHSESLVARIHFSQSATQLRLEVEDEGRGIPEEKRQEILSSGLPGVGLRGMRERIRQLGGSLEINPRPSGKGTIVVAVLPASDALEPAAITATTAGAGPSQLTAT